MSPPPPPASPVYHLHGRPGHRQNRYSTVHTIRFSQPGPHEAGKQASSTYTHTHPTRPRTSTTDKSPLPSLSNPSLRTTRTLQPLRHGFLLVSYVLQPIAPVYPGASNQIKSKHKCE
ncbi:uncharacterized protein K452DRAFT_128219 [Aplosporella prunicola CBS 121167]|uniref:Uncharacterized protein n=1 Tax=Aplosporella prunicola CBS 121167 TaxID=1176127 RepID=A0A6A6AZ51_9PEZI|nr:uncharacterized protein K452DRAFT_128219 [Aplosporella prunicola CBS 121167]KAF2136548.1 hypothetical protein K452DRAFT_128219 [Aplosporella prunicola CBS 121167]